MLGFLPALILRGDSGVGSGEVEGEDFAVGVAFGGHLVSPDLAEAYSVAVAFAVEVEGGVGEGDGVPVAAELVPA